MEQRETPPVSAPYAKKLTSPEEEVAVEAMADLPFLLALAGVPSPPTLCAERPVLITRAVFWRAARDCVRQNVGVSVDGEWSHYVL